MWINIVGLKGVIGQGIVVVVEFGLMIVSGIIGFGSDNDGFGCDTH